jgi:phage/plasmid-like protein (TIGR03299 family)
MGFLTEIETLEQVPRFEVVKEPLVNSDGKHNGVFALQRSDTGAHLGACGKKYRPIQMDEMFDILDTAGKRVGDINHTGFTLAGDGKRVVVQSKLGDPIDVQGDKVDGYFYTVIDNTGMGSNKCAASTIRIACDNALHMIENRRGDRLRHSSTFADNVQGMVDRIVQSVQDFTGFTSTVEFLKNAKFSRDQMAKLTQLLIPVEKDESTRRINQRENIVDLYKEGQGNVGESRWDALNAFTEFETHRRRQSPEKLVRSLMGNTLSTRALRVLREPKIQWAG